MTDAPLTADIAYPLATNEGLAPPPEIVPTPLLTFDDLRFFATCYLAGLIFFLVMLS